MPPGHEMSVILILILRFWWIQVIFFITLVLLILLPFIATFRSPWSEEFLLQAHFFLHSCDGIIKFAIIINYFFSLFIFLRLQGSIIFLTIEEEGILGVLLGNGCIDSIDMRIVFKHIMIRKRQKLLGILSEHQHFILFINPPMIFLPLLIYRISLNFMVSNKFAL